MRTEVEMADFKKKNKLSAARDNNREMKREESTPDS